MQPRQGLRLSGARPSERTGREVVRLLALFVEAFDRLAMHAVRRERSGAQPEPAEGPTGFGHAFLALIARDLRRA